MCVALLASASFAAEPDAKLLSPSESIGPLPGTAVLLLAFAHGDIKSLKFSLRGKKRDAIKIAEVPSGPQLYIWRVPPGEYCLEKYYLYGSLYMPDPDDMLCFEVVEGALNHAGAIRAGSVGTGYTLLPALLIALLDKQRPELLKPGFRWNFGSADASGVEYSRLRSLEADVRDHGLPAVIDAYQNPNSQLGLRQLGDSYRYGDTVKVDKAKAFDFYLRAADRGDARAAALVCQQLDLGLGIPEDPKRAVEYCRFGAKRGDQIATWLLARLHARGRGGLVPDEVEQARLMSAIPDQAELARMILAETWGFEDGAGNQPDGAEAFRLAKVRYDGGDRNAGAYALAYYHSNGIGTPVDGESAVKYYEVSAKFGGGNEYLIIGNMYWAGKIVGRDLVKARGYFERYAAIQRTNANALAWYLAVVDDRKVRDGRRALKLQRKLLSEFKETAARVDTLAAAFAAAGDFDDAVKAQTRAVALAKKEKWSEASLAEVAARLELYKSGKVYTRAEP